MPSFTVSAEQAGERLDVTLARLLGTSRARAQRLIESGAVLVDDRRQPKHHRLSLGERVDYPEPVEQTTTLAPEAVPLRVVYEDEWLLVVDKPAGVVVHPAPGHEHGTLVHGLLERGIQGGHALRPGIVHRLDKDTSGLLIVARSDVAYRRLVEEMAARHIQRTYSALLVGHLPQDEGVIDAPIGRHIRDRQRMSLHTAVGRRAVTHFRVRQRLAGYTLVEVQLETGRTHQIRVHFAALGYPVAGDVVYGRRPRPAGLARQFLHAAQLTFTHPIGGQRLDFVAPLPADLQRFLQSLV